MHGILAAVFGLLTFVSLILAMIVPFGSLEGCSISRKGNLQSFRYQVLASFFFAGTVWAISSEALIALGALDFMLIFAVLSYAIGCFGLWVRDRYLRNHQ